MDVDMHDAFSLDSAQNLFVRLLQAALAYVVALTIVAAVSLDVVVVNLTYVAQHMCRYRFVVYAQGTLLYIEAIELVEVALP